MPSLFPNFTAPEAFRPGDCVRKFVSPINLSYIGIVTHIIPATYKVWVQWPNAVSQEDPQELVRVNPAIHGLPSVLVDKGYSSYEKTRSEKRFGKIPKFASVDKMSIRIAHNFASEVIDKVLENIEASKRDNLSDVQAYNRVYEKYGTICSDHILQYSVRKVY